MWGAGVAGLGWVCSGVDEGGEGSLFGGNGEVFQVLGSHSSSLGLIGLVKFE